jgi:glycerol-3-phosphate dehydrogenase subunit B
MAAVEFSTEGDSITWVATSTSARPLRHHARTYLLATGGFLGGGFNSDHTGRSWETLFNLPLSLPNSRGHWFRPEFLDPAGHPIFQGGVQVNQAWQPVDAHGNVIYGNLWAAGNLLAHADTIRTRSHEALALATGAAAAQAILAQHQRAESPL